MPRSIRRLLPQDIDVAILRANLIKRIVRAIPLVLNFLDRILALVEPKTNRPLVCFPSGIAIYFQLHFRITAGQDHFVKTRVPKDSHHRTRLGDFL